MSVVGIVQSNYIPWRGYFDLIAACDIFVLYDDMQYTRRDWRNRNKIKTSAGLQWLTIPVKVKGKYNQKISDVEIQGERWQTDHWKTITYSYGKSVYFQEIQDLLGPIFLKSDFVYLSDFNLKLIKAICCYLGIKTKIVKSSDFIITGRKSETLASICDQLGAKTYLSGPTAKDYLEEKVFNNLSVNVNWFSYSDYKVYNQLWGEFEPQVSIIDLLFNCGLKSRNFIKN